MSDDQFDFSRYRSPVGGTPPASDPFGDGGWPTSAPTGGDSVFDEQPAAGQLRVATAPWPLLAVAAALSVAGGALALVLGGQPVWAFVGWFVAGPAAFAALSRYTTVDTRRRARDVYSCPAWLGPAYWGTVVLALAGLAVGALRIADWAARQ